MPLAGTNMNLFSNSLLMKAMAQESGYGYESRLMGRKTDLIIQPTMTTNMNVRQVHSKGSM